MNATSSISLFLQVHLNLLLILTPLFLSVLARANDINCHFTLSILITPETQNYYKVDWMENDNKKLIINGMKTKSDYFGELDWTEVDLKATSPTIYVLQDNLRNHLTIRVKGEYVAGIQYKSFYSFEIQKVRRNYEGTCIFSPSS